MLEKQECTRTKIVEKIFYAVSKMEATVAFLFSFSHISILAKISQFSTMGTVVFGVLLLARYCLTAYMLPDSHTTTSARAPTAY